MAKIGLCDIHWAGVFKKIEKSCEKGVDSPGCICQFVGAYGNHSKKNEN